MKNHLRILAGLTGLALVLRFLSFFPTVINHDESTYLVIADSLVKGATYLVDYVDVKPVGIFLLIAAHLVVFGKSIFVFRLMVALIIALTAFGLYLIQRNWGQSTKVALASAIIYVILNSLFTFYGVSPNTETFFNLFTVFGLLLILRKKGGYEYFIAGTLLGVSFMIKYVVAFDILAFGLFLIWEAAYGKTSFTLFFRRTLVLVSGFFLAPGFTLLYHQMTDTFDLWWFYSFVVPGRYPELHEWQDYLVYPLDFFLRFLPVSMCYFFVLVSRKANKEILLFGMLWSALSFLAVMIPGNAYGHYFIQFMLPFSLISGLAWNTETNDLPGGLKWIQHNKIIYRSLGGLILLNFVFQYGDYWKKPDYPKQIAGYLEQKLTPEDQIYTGNGSQILYFLLDKKVPNTFVHPSLFWEPKHLEAMEIDVTAEVDKIKTSDPRFVIIKDDYPDNRFDEWLATSYHIDTTFRKGRITLYERND